MEWPQITMIVLFAIGLFNHMNNHGKPTNDEYHFFCRLFAVSVWSTILYFGGFWG